MTASRRSVRRLRPYRSRASSAAFSALESWARRAEVTVWKRERSVCASVRRESVVRELTEDVTLDVEEAGAVAKVEGSEGSMGMLEGFEEDESAVEVEDGWRDIVLVWLTRSVRPLLASVLAAAISLRASV